MAYDKAVDSVVLDAGLAATADAIREKTSGTALIQWMNENGFKAAVEAIETGGVDVSAVTATATDVLTDKIFVDAEGNTVEGAMPNNGTISVTMDGLTKTSVTIPKGYISGGTVNLTNDIENALAAL